MLFYEKKNVVIVMTENILLKLPKHLPLEYDKDGDLTVKTTADDCYNKLKEKDLIK